MGVDEIRSYISSDLKRGVPFHETKATLLRQGNSDFEINQALESMGKQNYVSTPSRGGLLSNMDSTLKTSIFALGGFIFFIIIILIIVGGSSKTPESLFTVDEDAISTGESFEIFEKNLIEIEYGEFYDEIEVEKDDESYSFKGDGLNFVLWPGENRDIDFDLDGVSDFTFFLEKFGDGARLMIKSVDVCVENWICTDWGECLSSVKTRTCDDSNNCGIVESKPVVSESCVVTVENSTNESASVTPVAGLTPWSVCSVLKLEYTENSSDFCVNGTETVHEYNNTLINCCSGYYINATQTVCDKTFPGTIAMTTGQTCSGNKIVRTYGDNVAYCCNGTSVFDDYAMTDEINVSWFDLEVTDICDTNYSDHLLNCEKYKCTILNDFEKGILFNNTDEGCVTYEEISSEVIEICKFTEELWENASIYWNEYYSGDLSGTFMSDMDEIGVCQTISIN